MLEVGHVIHDFQREAVAMIERGTGEVGGEILAILSAPWRGVRAEDVGGRVIDGMAPGVSSDELQSIGKRRVSVFAQP